MEALLVRAEVNDHQSLGHLFVFDGIHLVWSCCTLEPGWLDNKRQVSCIPEGQYTAFRRHSEKYKDHWHIRMPCGSEMDERCLILIHWGNYRRHTKGCVLLGRTHTDIDGDGYRDVTSSKATMGQLNTLMKDVDSFDLTIVHV